MVNQSSQTITLAQWMPVMMNWLGLRHVLLVGQGLKTLQHLQVDANAITRFKADIGAMANLNRIASTISNFSHQSTRTWLIAERTGCVQYHHVSFSSESGLLPAHALTCCWAGIKSLGNYSVSALSLDDAFTEACAQASVQTNEDRAMTSLPAADWIWLGCMPATALLRGATKLLLQLKVVVLRVLLHPDAEPEASLPTAQAWLQANGFVLCGVEPERNPRLGIAVFVRDYFAALHATQQQRNDIAYALEHLQVQLQTMQQEKLDLQNDYGQQVAQLQSEKTALYQQRGELEKERDLLQVHVQSLLQEQSRLATDRSFLSNQLDAQVELVKGFVLLDKLGTHPGSNFAQDAHAQLKTTIELDESDRPPLDKNLLQRAFTQWQFGDWQSLCNIDPNALQKHPDRARLALYAAAGQQQIGDVGLTRQFIRLAQNWGCEISLIKQVLISGAHNTLARAAAALGQVERSHKHFKAAIDAVIPECDSLIKQARISLQLQQLEKLGLDNSNLPDNPV